MTLKDIAAISGKPGLFRIVKPAHKGVIVETLDDKKIKSSVVGNLRISTLKEISMYVHTAEEAVSLASVLKTVKEKYGDTIEVDTNDTKALKQFMESVLPEYDREKVYPSDMKKLIVWYKTLHKFAPQVFDNLDEAAAPADEQEA